MNRVLIRISEFALPLCWWKLADSIITPVGLFPFFEKRIIIPKGPLPKKRKGPPAGRRRPSTAQPRGLATKLAPGTTAANPRPSSRGVSAIGLQPSRHGAARLLRPVAIAPGAVRVVARARPVWLLSRHPPGGDGWPRHLTSDHAIPPGCYWL